MLDLLLADVSGGICILECPLVAIIKLRGVTTKLKYNIFHHANFQGTFYNTCLQLCETEQMIEAFVYFRGGYSTVVLHYTESFALDN